MAGFCGIGIGVRDVDYVHLSGGLRNFEVGAKLACGTRWA